MESAFRITVKCGGSTKRAFNQVVLEFPDSDYEELLDLGVASSLLATTAEVWEPRFAVITHTSLTANVRTAADGFRPGWLTYLPHDSTRAAGAHEITTYVRDVSTLGQIFAVTDRYENASPDMLEPWSAV